MATERRYNAQTGETEEVEYTHSLPPVPEVVTIRQAKLALLAGGLLDDADAAVAAAGQAAQIEWEYATEVRRDNTLVTGIGAALGLNEAQIDALFIAAAAIV
jgi:hypothetical protein